MSITNVRKKTCLQQSEGLYIERLNELLEKQETAEDGKESKSVTVNGRKDFRRWTVRQWGAARDKGFRRQYWVRVDAGDTWSLRFGAPLPWRRSLTQSRSNFWRRRRQAKVGQPIVRRTSVLWHDRLLIWRIARATESCTCSKDMALCFEHESHPLPMLFGINLIHFFEGKNNRATWESRNKEGEIFWQWKVRTHGEFQPNNGDH